MSVPGVVGVAIGEYGGEPCLTVYVAEKTQEVEERIPSQVESYPVVVEATGEFRALD